MSLQDAWAKDPVASSPHLKKDVEKAVQILQEEGYSPVSDNSGIGADLYERTDDEGVRETVMVMHGFLNGTMVFTKGDEEPRNVMAWDYSREMRPNPVQRGLRALKRGLGLNG